MVWPDSLPKSLVEGAGLQQVFCCLTATAARALLCEDNAECGAQVVVQAVVECPEPKFFEPKRPEPNFLSRNVLSRTS